jgi:uncharacterized MnhB-related membrane protein
MTPAMTKVLQVGILVLVMGGAALVATARGRVRQVIALSAYGVALAVLFRTVRVPGVTLSELVAGAVALPLILLLTIARVRWRR